MKENKIKKEGEANYYKIATYVLLVVLIVAGLVFGYNTLTKTKYDQGYSQGRIDTANAVVGEIVQTGQLNVPYQNQTVVMIPSQAIGQAQQQLMQTIIDEVQTKGYISIADNESEIILVPYQPPAQEQ